MGSTIVVEPFETVQTPLENDAEAVWNPGTLVLICAQPEVQASD